MPSPRWITIHQLLLLLSSCSYRDSALAFAQHGSVQALLPPSAAVRANKKGVRGAKFAKVPFIQQSIMTSSSLRVRGGAAATKLSAATSRDSSSDNSNNETLDKTAQRALQSIQFCVKMCFFSVISNIFITFVDDNLYSKFFGAASTHSLTWKDYADIFDSLSLLFFGEGLWRISQLYWRSFSNMDKRMTHDNLLELFTYMSWIWGIVAVNMGLVSLSMAASLPGLVGGPLSFLFDRVTSKQLAICLGGILGAGSFAILRDCRKTADEEVAAYQKKNDIREGKQRILEQRNSNAQKFDLVRNAGYRAYCNQALCAGSFAVMAGMELTKWIVSLNASTIVGHIFSISEFLTPFAIAGLLFTLNRALVRAAIAEVIGDTDRVSKNDDEIYKDLFVAQAGFYNEAAGTMKMATIFQLLPYILAPVLAPAIPFVLKALKKMLSPALFTKVIDVFGIKM